jgi:hypothetical protein
MILRNVREDEWVVVRESHLNSAKLAFAATISPLFSAHYCLQNVTSMASSHVKGDQEAGSPKHPAHDTPAHERTEIERCEHPVVPEP